MSTESEDGPLSNEMSQLYDDDTSRGIMSEIILKKGPWTAAEDAILMDYVNKHGEGNWNAVQKHSGLFRCGKSCRLRWANHLRPNLKKGPFTAEEERLIIELQAKMGNKWARMAAHLPGRTDNEIKNYWNTRIKRRHRSGLSPYPREACLPALLHSTSESSDNMLFGSIGPSQQSNFSSSQPPKRYCGQRSRECGSEVIIKNELYSLEPVQDDPQVKSAGFIFPYDRGPGGHNWSLGVIQDNHSFVPSNFSTPKLACEAVKSELPSFQYPDTDSSNWDTSYSASPLLDPYESKTQYESGTSTGIVHSECSSPRNSGLLDALLYEARTISGVKNQSSKKSSNSSAVTPINYSGEIGHKFCETEIQNKSEPISPLDSATSVYSGSVLTPAVSGTQNDSHPFTETFSEPKLQGEPVYNACNPFEDNIPASFNSLDPGMSPYTDWLEQESSSTMKQTSLEEAVAEALLSSNELSADFRYSSSKPRHGWGVGSYVWNNMHMVHQVSKLP